MKIKVFETVYSTPSRVDREQGILYGCKLLGRLSKNGREYSANALKEAARLYESLGIDVDHHKDKRTERSLRDLIGIRPKNVKVTQDGVFGDVHLLLSDPLSHKILEAAEKDPAVFGFSHEADLGARKSKKGYYVESVTKVHSLDMVRHPATTRGAFESEDRMADEIRVVEQEEEQPKDCYSLLAEAMAAATREGNMELATKIHKLLKPEAKEAEAAAGEETPEEEAKEKGMESVQRGATEQDVLALAGVMQVAPAAAKALSKTLAGKPVKEVIGVFESIAPPAKGKKVNSEQAPVAPASSREERVKRYKVS